MVIYIILMFILLFACWRYTNMGLDVTILNKGSKQRVVFFILIGLLTLLQGLRDASVGGDLYENYQRHYITFGNSSWSYLFINREYQPGYIVLNKLIYVISGGNLQALLFVIAGLYHWAISRIIIKYSPNVFFSLFLFLTTSAYNVSMNELRSTLALTMVLFGLPYLLEKKNVRYILFLGLAYLFHRTSIAFFLLLFALNLKNRKQFYLFSGLFAAVVIVGYNKITTMIADFFPRYEKYVGGTIESGGGGYALFAFLVLITVVIILLADEKCFEKEHNEKFFRMLICAIVLQLFTFKVHFFSRIVIEHFSISTLFVIPAFCLENRISKNSRYILNYSIAAGFCAFYIFSLIQNNSMTVPYRFFFFGGGV